MPCLSQRSFDRVEPTSATIVLPRLIVRLCASDSSASRRLKKDHIKVQFAPTIMLFQALSTTPLLIYVITSVEGDSRHYWERCEKYSDGTITVPYYPYDEGAFSVQFFVAPRRWDASRQIPLTLRLNYTNSNDEATKMREFVLVEPLSQGKGPGLNSSSNAPTSFSIPDLRVGWNEIHLSWFLYEQSRTLYIDDFQSGVTIERGAQMNLTVNGMGSFINCVQGVWRNYRFSPYSRTLTVPFQWEEHGKQEMVTNIRPQELILTTYPRGNNLSLCQWQASSKPWVYNLTRRCVFGWSDASDQNHETVIIYPSNADLEKEEDCVVVRRYRFLQILVTYTGSERGKKWLITRLQRQAPITYEEVFLHKGLTCMTMGAIYAAVPLLVIILILTLLLKVSRRKCQHLKVENREIRKTELLSKAQKNIRDEEKWLYDSHPHRIRQRKDSRKLVRRSSDPGRYCNDTRINFPPNLLGETNRGC